MKITKHMGYLCPCSHKCPICILDGFELFGGITFFLEALLVVIISLNILF